MAKNNQEKNEPVIEGLEVPEGFEVVDQASEFLKLDVGDQFIGKFIRIEEVESQYNKLQECWLVKDEKRKLTLLLPEKATMRQFRSLLKPGTIFWLACVGKAVSKNDSEYYTYEFGIKK